MDKIAAIAEARGALKSMPDDVFEWFADRIAANGWPPRGAAWRGALRDRSFSRWTTMSWRKQQVPLTYDQLAPAAQQIVDGILSGVFLGVPSVETRYVGDSGTRIKSALVYAAQYRRLPGELILLEDQGRFDLVDGCHRTALLVHLQRLRLDRALLPENPTVWIGG